MIQTQEQRINRLGRQNRWILGLGSFLSAGLAILVLVAQGAPGNSTIRAERFVVTDGGGTEWAELGLREGGPALVIHDTKGHPATTLGVFKHGAGLWITGQEGRPRARFVADGDTTDLRMFDNTGRPRR